MIKYTRNAKKDYWTKEIECACCGNMFVINSSVPNKKYCSEKCSKTAQRAKYVRKEYWTEERECACCGNMFVWSSSVPNKKYCSEECSKKMIYIKANIGKLDNELQTEERHCACCGNLFVWTSSKPNRKYCSTECTTNALRNKVSPREIQSEKRQCVVCGKDFEWFSNKSNQKYCSKECRIVATANNIKKSRIPEMDALKNEIYLKVSEIICKMNQSKGNVFNDKFINYWEVGDISETTRELVLRRDNFECKICKRKDSLHLHHLIKRKYGGNHEADNLVALCASCHRHIETGDVQHATNKCLKNAKKYYGIEEEKKVDVNLETIKNGLSSLFDKMKDSTTIENSEIMVQLDEILDLIDENT